MAEEITARAVSKVNPAAVQSAARLNFTTIGRSVDINEKNRFATVTVSSSHNIGRRSQIYSAPS
jgi:hypothetical protein